MSKLVTAPLEGKAIRFAPGRDQEPATYFWKVWTEGNEIYALTRSPRGAPKISIHASGQIHYRVAPKQKQDLRPPMQMGSGPWLHAIELRFLLSPRAQLPYGQRESLKKKKGYLIDVPDGYYLCANLIVGSAKIGFDHPLPTEFLPSGEKFWRTQLHDGRPVILVMRVLKFDENNLQLLRHIHEELKPTITFPTMPQNKYGEIYNLHWSPAGGNVILVIPMGEDVYRSDEDLLQPNVPLPAPRQFRYQSFHSSADIIAPDGRRVAVIEIAEVDKPIELVEGLPKIAELGTLTMRIETENLILGSKFMASPCRLVGKRALGGGSLRTTEHKIQAQYDGFRLTAEIRETSGALQNKNLTSAISGLDNSEEIVMAIPSETQNLSATLDHPTTSTELLGRFTLRNRR